MTDLIGNDGGSKALEALSRKFNLTPEQTRAAVDELAPAVMSGIRGETASPEGLQGLIAALVNGDHGRYLDGDESGMTTDGNGILGHIFGSKDVSRGVAAHAARETGLGDDTMKQMLPMVASLVMGALGKNMMGDQAATKGGGLADILGQVLGGSGGAGSSGSSAGFGDILGQMLGGASAPAAAGSGSGGIGNIGDLLGGIGGGTKAAASPAGGGLDDILGAVFGNAAPPEVRSGAAERARNTLGTALGANTPKGAKGDKMLNKVKKDLGHA